MNNFSDFRSWLHDMPAGVSWPTYLKFSVAAALSMIAGAQTVHAVYKPLDDLEKFIEERDANKIIKSLRLLKAKVDLDYRSLFSIIN